jgi:hypothetical protein
MAASDPFLGAAGILDAPAPAADRPSSAAEVAAGLASGFWRRLDAAYRPGAGNTAASSSLERILGWLGFSIARFFRAAPVRGGGERPWRSYSISASCAPPLPAWGDGRPDGLSVIVWPGGGGDAGRGLTEALDGWAPCPGSVELAVSLAPLGPEDRGRVAGWARGAGRDLAVLDPLLMAALAAMAPSDAGRRNGLLFAAGGAYGAYDPFGRFDPFGTADPFSPSGSLPRLAPAAGCGPVPFRGRGGYADDLSRQISFFRGVVRIEGPAGAGKSALLARALDRAAGPANRFGDKACLIDWPGMDPGDVARHGPLGAALRRAAREMGIAGWDYRASASDNVSRLESRGGALGRPGRATVLVDRADGLVDSMLACPADLGLFRGIARREGSFKLVLAGRRLCRRLERHPASPFAALRPPLSLRVPGPGRLYGALAVPLAAAGWVFESPWLPYRALAAAFWNPGALSIAGARILAEAAKDLAPCAPPPFTVTEAAVDRALSDPATVEALRGIGLAPASDPLERALALAVAAVGRGKGSRSGGGAAYGRILADLRASWPEAFGDMGEEEIRLLTFGLGRSGLLARDAGGTRFRSEAQGRLLGDPVHAAALLSGLAGRPAPPEAALFSARRIITVPVAPKATAVVAGLAGQGGCGARSCLEGSGGLAGQGGRDARACLEGSGGLAGQEGCDARACLAGSGDRACLAGSGDRACLAGSGDRAGMAGSGDCTGQAGSDVLAALAGGADRAARSLKGGGAALADADLAKPGAVGFRVGGASGPEASTAVTDRQGSRIPEGLADDAPSAAWLAILTGLDRLPAPGSPDAGRVGGHPLPVPSPFTLLQEAELFGRRRSAPRMVVVSLASGAERAGDAIRSLCALEGLSGASDAVFFAPGPDSGAEAARRLRILEEDVACRRHGGGVLHVAADALTPLDGGKPADVFKALSLMARDGGPERPGGPVLTYLCGPESALALTGDERRSERPVFAGRWTVAAAGIWLAACGLDPDKAAGIIARTGGWDSLVMAEAHSLAGLAYRVRPPEEGSNAVPEGLCRAALSLRGRGATAAAGIVAACPGLAEVGVAGSGHVELLTGLTVLVPAGERDGKPLWELDPRFG